MAEYMAARIGQEYEGVISGVTGWGFYVELPSTVEGLVHVSTLRGDYYHFDEDNYRLIGEITKREFTLGQRVRVRVADADVETKTVDFVLTGERKMSKEKDSRLIANNKKAYHDYFIEEKYEAGVSLHGTEVKSLRMGKCSIKESFIRIENGEVYVYGMHISPMRKGIFSTRILCVPKSC